MGSVWKRVFGVAAGPAGFALVLLLWPGSGSEGRTAAIAVWMAVWWMTEAVPLAATSLLPLVLLPLTGVLSTAAVAPAYANSVIFLFLGGFLIAAAMQKWELHRRIALGIMMAFGASPRRLLLGFLTASAVLSMWVSNTATAIMIVPIGLALVHRSDAELKSGQARKLAQALMLGTAYGCSIGGIATLIGTPPNMVMARMAAQTFPELAPIGFARWFLLAFPLAVLALTATFLVLARDLRDVPSLDSGDHLRAQYAQLGRPSREEYGVLSLGVLAAVLWVFRADIEFGALVIPGWSRLLPFGKLVDDGTVALFVGTLLFVFPSRSGTLLDRHDFASLPWGVVLLFGGGFALAEAFDRSGLARLVGGSLSGLGALPPFLLVLVVCLSIAFASELASNTALAQISLPILAALARELHLSPLPLLFAATISASLAFMLPVGTPPNAIAFGSERIGVGYMARAGLFLNVICALFTALVAYFVLPLIMD